MHLPIIRRPAPEGQVLLLGIVIMLVLLLAILFLFDIHNVIRAKFKTETAQQAAALAAANWQKESLNLIGEINLIKAAETLLQDEGRWVDVPQLEPDPVTGEPSPYPLKPRIDLLTEMQTRISFIGPLIGFAAAQQAAKRNGLNPSTDLDSYIELLNTHNRYSSHPLVNNYRWKAPYLQLIRSIVGNGIAVAPNARLTSNPIVYPSELAQQALYDALSRHYTEINAGLTPPVQTTWNDAGLSLYTKPDSYFKGKWWDIDYSMIRFPNESEIYTLGVMYGGSYGTYNGVYYQDYLATLQQLLADQQFYAENEIPEGMRWCRYDNFWYPQYYRDRYESDYDVNHYNYWFRSGVLRRDVKKQYIYEGPAAYAEGRVSVQGVYLAGKLNNPRTIGRDERQGSAIRTFTTAVGSRREDPDSSNPINTDYRPGAIAKPLGELSRNRPPIDIPLVLPVFDSASVMPTYMPVPYGFGVLRTGYSSLERFLNWLSRQDSLNGYTEPPPAGTEYYLFLLQQLADGEHYRYYGYNQKFDESGFDARWKNRMDEYHKNRDRIVYLPTPDQSAGPGWLQEPRLFNTSEVTTSKDAIAAGVLISPVSGKPIYLRFTDSTRKSLYMVYEDHIINNSDLDPSRYYGINTPGTGPGFGGTNTAPDLMPGPPRL